MTTEAEAIAELARRPELTEKDGRTWIVHHHEEVVTELVDEHHLKQNKPRYIAQRVALTTAVSLVSYVNKFKNEDTIVFADAGNSSVEAVIDFHKKDGAEHAAHRAVLRLQCSEEWKAWHGLSDRLVPQLDFARFLEEHKIDIHDPPFGALLDAVRDLQATRKVTFNKVVRTAGGTERFEYLEEQSAVRDGVELPAEFRLVIPVYFGEQTWEVRAFLRWKISDGDLLLGIKIIEQQKMVEHAFAHIVEGIEEDTGCMTLSGAIL